jgi:hypothetical protein
VISTACGAISGLPVLGAEGLLESRTRETVSRDLIVFLKKNISSSCRLGKTLSGGRSIPWPARRWVRIVDRAFRGPEEISQAVIVPSLGKMSRPVVSSELITPLMVATPRSSATRNAEIRQSQAMFR